MMSRFHIVLMFAGVLGLFGQYFCVQRCAGQQTVTSQNLAPLTQDTPLAGLMTGLYSSGQASPKFLCFGGIEPERREAIVADTQVLNHLLNRGLPQHPTRWTMGVNVRPAGDNAMFYVDGTGLILVYCVDFPVAVFEETAEEAETKSDTLTDWEKAKQELQTGQGRFVRSDPFTSGSVTYSTAPTGSLMATVADTVAFDKELVERLDECVTSALVQAGNFRALKDNDSITIYIYGPSGVPNERTVIAWQARVADAGSDKLIPESKIERQQYRESDSVRPTSFPRAVGK
jgi:hypothetical protein